jgi:hypothetical protein
VSGDSGSFRWNVVAENGRVLAASTELFATPADAARAGRDVRALISGATVAAYEPPESIDQTERHVSRQPDGRWRVDVAGSTHALSTHVTQAEAISAAQVSARARGAGTVVVHEEDGRIRRLEASHV